MRFILRLFGLWLLALGVVLLVIDGIKSLAAAAIVITPIRENWAQLNPDSLAASARWMEDLLDPFSLSFAVELALSWPGWAVMGTVGLVLLLVGTPKHQRLYVEAR